MPELTSIANFTVSNRCTGRCTTCNIWKMDPHLDPTLKQVSDFFDENRETLRNLKFIQLTGGEPFLRDDLPEIASIVHEAALKCMIWLPTNGLLPTRACVVFWTPTGGVLTSSLYDMIAELSLHRLRCYLSWAQRIGRRLECLDHLAAAEGP